jgi:hypothetical protein
MFNIGRYTERAASGELILIVKKSRLCLDSAIRNWIPGTESQELHFVDNNTNLLARAHRYLRPDGLLAASGMIDPKRLFENGQWYGLVSPED